MRDARAAGGPPRGGRVRRALLHLRERARPRRPRARPGVPHPPAPRGRDLPQEALRDEGGEALPLLPHAQLLALRLQERAPRAAPRVPLPLRRPVPRGEEARRGRRGDDRRPRQRPRDAGGLVDRGEGDARRLRPPPLLPPAPPPLPVAGLRDAAVVTEEAVTVAVVNYQGATHLPAALPAVRALEGPVAERLLIDSGSSDGSVDLVRRSFPEFRVIELGSNLGPAAARNRALREARTRLVLLLDNDVVPDPDSLRHLLAAFAPGVAAATPRALLDSDRTRIHYEGAHFHYVGLFALRNFYAPL